METEDQIIYQLLEGSTGGKLNNDKVTGEREIRAILRNQRARVIAAAYKDALTITEQEFQNFGVVDLLPASGLYTYALPQIIRLNNNAGIRCFLSAGYSIPIKSREAFRLDLNNPMGQFRPQAYMSDDTLFIAVGKSNPDMIDQGVVLDSMNSEISGTLKVQLEMILMDPDDQAGYDFTSSPYPLAPELIAKLKYDIGRMDLEPIIKTKPDEVANAKDDTINYHNQNRAQ